MTTVQRGRSAPWAKALGALLLAVTVAIVATIVVTNWRADKRQEAAFERTRTDAERYANRVLAHKGAFPDTRRQMEDILASSAGKGQGDGLLYDLAQPPGRVKVIVQFARRYERVSPILGPADQMADRCFTITFSNVETPRAVSRISAHDSDTTCTDVKATAHR